MPRNKYPEETRQKIIEAAIKTFQDKGFEQSTILDIVANMDGLTRGAFYHHFKSKDEVLKAITDILFYGESPFERVRHEKGLNGLQKLRKAFKLNVAESNNELRLASESLLESPQFFLENMKFNAILGKEFIQPLIEEGARDGSIKVENPRLIAELTIMLFSIWLTPAIFSGDIKYLEDKAMLSNEILTTLGLPLFDEEFLEIGEEYVEIMADIMEKHSADAKTDNSNTKQS